MESAIRVIEETEPQPHVSAMKTFQNDIRTVQSHVCFMTQSLDGALQRVFEGATDQIELRGNIRTMRCSACANVERTISLQNPTCPKCGGNNTMRPNCVLMDELMGKDNVPLLQSMRAAVQKADCILLVGNGWHDEEELSNSVFLHVMDGKPVVDFSESSRLRSGRVKCVAGNPIRTVPEFVRAFHELAAKKEHEVPIGKSQSKHLHQWQMMFPASHVPRAPAGSNDLLRSSHGTVVRGPKGQKIGKPLNLFKAVELTDMFEKSRMPDPVKQKQKAMAARDEARHVSRLIGFTGRRVMRFQESSNAKAKNIHKFLLANPFKG